MMSTVRTLKLARKVPEWSEKCLKVLALTCNTVHARRDPSRQLGQFPVNSFNKIFKGLPRAWRQGFHKWIRQPVPTRSLMENTGAGCLAYSSEKGQEGLTFFPVFGCSVTWFPSLRWSRSGNLEGGKRITLGRPSEMHPTFAPGHSVQRKNWGFGTSPGPFPWADLGSGLLIRSMQGNQFTGWKWQKLMKKPKRLTPFRGRAHNPYVSGRA